MELLAPAGSMDALKAAVENGADAVYLGGRLFNARQSAANFSIEEIADAVKYAHLRGVKIHITVNILIADDEFPELIEYIHELMQCNVDAIIVQDLGLLHVSKKVFPELPLHASTQMTIHNVHGTKWFQDEGMERVVLARELSIDEIKQIARNTSVELETFVHGALCIAYSGQCLFSSMIGGRSGNRGNCAQPCRMVYQLLDETGKLVLSNDFGDHLLSPKDLNTVELLPELDEAGVNSLKIEGRMKKPEYVATVVRVYRDALNRMLNGDKFGVSSQEQKDLAQVFNREFTSGYYLFNPGKNLMSYKRPNNRGTFLGRVVKLDQNKESLDIKLEDDLQAGDGIEIWVTKGGREGFFVKELKIAGTIVQKASKGDTISVNYNGFTREGDRIFKTSDIRLHTLAKESFASFTRKIGLSVYVTIAMHEPIHISLKDEDGNVVEITGDILAQPAKTTPTTPEMVRKQIERLGNTAFQVKSWNINITPETMLPVSEMNNQRRNVIAKLEELRLNKSLRYEIKEDYNKPFVEIFDSLHQQKSTIRNTKLSIAVSDFECFEACLSAKPDIVYIGGEQFRKNTLLTKEELAKAVQMAKSIHAQLVFSLPRIWHDHETKYLTERIKIATELGINAFQVSSPAGISFVKEIAPGAEIYADYSFNVFNSYALKYLSSNNIKLATLSPELTLKQIRDIKGLNTNAECLVFGAMPLMVSEHCMLGSAICGRTETTKCNVACKDKRYFLLDRLKYKFPIHTDMVCRMHIYNAKTLNLLPNLEEIIDISPCAVRLDLRTEEPADVKNVAHIFSKALKFINDGFSFDANSLQQELDGIYPQGFTKGHYFRGVTNTEE